MCLSVSATVHRHELELACAWGESDKHATVGMQLDAHVLVEKLRKLLTELHSLAFTALSGEGMTLAGNAGCWVCGGCVQAYLYPAQSCNGACACLELAKHPVAELISCGCFRVL